MRTFLITLAMLVLVGACIEPIPSNDPGPSCGDGVCESGESCVADCGSDVSYPAIVEVSAASGLSIVSDLDASEGSVAIVDSSSAAFDTGIENAGYVYVRMYGPSTEEDRFFVTIGSESIRRFPSQHGAYEWVETQSNVSGGVGLAAGELNAHLDVIVLSEQPLTTSELDTLIGMQTDEPINDTDPTEAPTDSTIDGSGSNGLRVGSIRVLDSTMHSISIEWDVDGDADHDAVSSVTLREAGTSGWSEVMPLLRIDSTYPEYLTQYGRPAQEEFDMFAGSIMFLSPGTEYELLLEIEDPDGGSATRVRTIRTQPYPERSASCTNTVTPSTFSSVYDSAGAGDVLCLQDGNYGDLRGDRGGSEGAYLALVPADGASPRFERIRVETDHLWIEGMTFDTPQTYGAIRASGPSEHVVVMRNTFEGSFYSINLGSNGQRWYVVDNTINGHDPVIGTFEGEGIEMGTSSGHTIAFNTIRKTADAVSYGSGNIDFFGNDAYRMADDGIEADRGYANKRYWGNRIVDSYNYAISFQPMYVGPHYFLYNEIRQTDWTRQDRSESSQGGTIFKFNGYVDRFVLAHNTFVHEGTSPLAQPRLKMLLSTYSRNNLYAVEDSPVWRYHDWSESTAIPAGSFYDNDWRTDVDYDAFAWSGSPGFEWDGSHDSISSFADAIGIETNGVRFSLDDFENYPTDLRPRSNTPIVDSGAIVSGMNDNHIGSAPDRGAYEYGADPMPIGAGPETTRRERHAYWEQH